eukprot:scaffold32212_cov20-Tisochrysis_lutea.AAC.4
MQGRRGLFRITEVIICFAPPSWAFSMLDIRQSLLGFMFLAVATFCIVGLGRFCTLQHRAEI